ncbi:hypothetical protein CYMTET_11644 [Cymbomonas tetramitiformis]|uniref:Uncharacterized protein n=1 Tax=Cymbomonas tetramitiformis TaxID=36881 RepID=A0AAE0GNA9_9CHLO|nr:hypothetical protein CYMTET_11644 [Cymbomonas tetramitiformis]
MFAKDVQSPMRRFWDAEVAGDWDYWDYVACSETQTCTATREDWDPAPMHLRQCRVHCSCAVHCVYPYARAAAAPVHPAPQQREPSTSAPLEPSAAGPPRLHKRTEHRSRPRAPSAATAPGDACEIVDEDVYCSNQCMNRGQCMGGFCKCQVAAPHLMHWVLLL